METFDILLMLLQSHSQYLLSLYLSRGDDERNTVHRGGIPDTTATKEPPVLTVSHYPEGLVQTVESRAATHHPRYLSGAIISIRC